MDEQKPVEQLQAEVNSLKKKLDEVNAVKESWYQKKEAISQKIKGSIGSLKSSKEERNQKTSEVKTIKAERDALNAKIKEKVEEVKLLNDAKQKLVEKFGLKEDPSHIRARIEAMEHKQETEVMSFDKEKALNKQIKELKKQLVSGEEVNKVFAALSEKNKELRSLRSDAEKKHRQLQQIANASQEKHETLLASSGELNTLREQEEEAYKMFFKFKQEFAVLNDQLKELLKQLNSLNHQAGVVRDKKRSDRQAEKTQALAELEKNVEEKIKKKQKLTTEDLLVFQKNGSN